MLVSRDEVNNHPCRSAAICGRFYELTRIGRFAWDEHHLHPCCRPLRAQQKCRAHES